MGRHAVAAITLMEPVNLNTKSAEVPPHLYLSTTPMYVFVSTMPKRNCLYRFLLNFWFRFRKHLFYPPPSSRSTTESILILEDPSKPPRRPTTTPANREEFGSFWLDFGRRVLLDWFGSAWLENLRFYQRKPQNNSTTKNHLWRTTDSPTPEIEAIVAEDDDDDDLNETEQTDVSTVSNEHLYCDTKGALTIFYLPRRRKVYE